MVKLLVGGSTEVTSGTLPPSSLNRSQLLEAESARILSRVEATSV